MQGSNTFGMFPRLFLLDTQNRENKALDLICIKTISVCFRHTCTHVRINFRRPFMFYFKFIVCVCFLALLITYTYTIILDWFDFKPPFINNQLIYNITKHLHTHTTRMKGFINRERNVANYYEIKTNGN